MDKIKKIISKDSVQVVFIVLLSFLAMTILPTPAFFNRFMMKVVNEGMIYFITVLGLTVVLGMGGQVTFSTAGMMGIGAYISAILSTQYGMSPVLALLIALVVGGIASFFIGLALFRLKGSYFAFASIGFTQLIFTVLSNWIEVTGGPDGIGNIPKLDFGFYTVTDYYSGFKVYVILALICGLIVHRLRKTYFGRGLASVRDNELTAQCMGVDVYRTKVYSFVIAGIFACLAGSLYTHHAGYISPDIFNFEQSSIYLIMIMLGGVDSTVGALIGALLLTILPERIRFLQDYYRLVYGISVIILMNVMPMGIMGALNNLKYSYRRMLKREKKKEKVA